MNTCAQLGVPLYVVHPDSCTGDELQQQRKLVEAQSQASKKGTKKKPKKTEVKLEPASSSIEKDWGEATVRRQSITLAAECMVQVLNSTENVMLVAENMAGQGQVLERSFRELRAILGGVATLRTQQNSQSSQPESHLRRPAIHERVGVCLDTCHAFASGYDLRTVDGCEQMMRDFDNLMLPQWPNALKVVHLNDSKTVCDSNVDRHANIGQGEMGIEAFRWIMNSERFENLPLILETPRAKQPKNPRKKQKKSSMETEAEIVEMETNNADLGSKKRVRETQTVASFEGNGEQVIAPAIEELELLYSLALDD